MALRELGFRALKFFPASQRRAKYLASLASPCRFDFLPTGGIDAIKAATILHLPMWLASAARGWLRLRLSRRKISAGSNSSHGKRPLSAAAVERGNRMARAGSRRRQAMIDACLKMNTPASIRHGGQSFGTLENGLLITPSGVPYDEMTVDDIVFMDMDAIISTGSRSSEWRFHRDILQGAGSEPVSMRIRFMPRPLPSVYGDTAVHYMIARRRADDSLPPYETYGTEELSKRCWKR